MELVLEQTQQGTSYEVSVSAEGVEELKRKVKIKGEKKEASLHLGRNRVNTSAVKNHKDDYKTKSASKGLETVHTKPTTRKGANYIEKEIAFAKDEFVTSPDLSRSDNTKIEIKLEDLSKLVPNLEVDFMDLDSSEDDQPIIVKDEEEEEVHVKHDKAKKAKIKTLDALPSLLQKVTEALNRGLIKKDKGKKAMSSKDAKEGDTGSDSDKDANSTGSMVKSSKKKLKKFDFVTEGSYHIYLTAKQIKEQKRIEESVKADLAKQEVELGKDELVDLLGIEVVTGFYKAKLEYDKYYDKMLNKRGQSKITSYDVLIRKGPITLKVYREDGTSEIIPNFKASDLHLSEWREVVQDCSKRTRAGWNTIFSQIQTRMDYLHKTKVELEIDFNKPLSEQDTILKLNVKKKEEKAWEIVRLVPEPFSLSDNFHDNMHAHFIQLDNEIHNMAIGNLSGNDYFQELKSKADRLANLSSKVNDESLFTYAINGARSKFQEVSHIIRHQEELPTFDETRSMILLE
nr:Toll/interleukin-1 receptor (TIR) domain-containing protein [Tanacetum cinerariifolium]